MQSVTVYWYDDGPWGGCRVPKRWRIFYKDEKGDWHPVEGADKYPVAKGVPCTVNFEPVTTAGLRLEADLPDDNSAGVFEWEVK